MSARYPRKRGFRYPSHCSALATPTRCAELRHIASTAALPITFGGEVHDDTLILSEFVGTRTAGMRGLAVLPSAGLGGATMVARRPISQAVTKARRLRLLP